MCLAPASLCPRNIPRWRKRQRMYDLIIRGGDIVDGTGAGAFCGDIAILDGYIAAVGAVAGVARDEIDAGGLMVPPGWVDNHSHMGGQATDARPGRLLRAA